eukprot:COSAG02_NODE_2093_length_9852_cov_2.404286_10_plen_70_part_00
MMMETQAQDFGMRIWFHAQESGEPVPTKLRSNRFLGFSAPEKHTRCVAIVETLLECLLQEIRASASKSW